MGKQMGIIPLKGTIDNLTFYVSPDGFLFRRKRIVSRETFQTHPSFAVQRRNSGEFGIAAKAGKLLTDSISAAMKLVKDRKATCRLLSVLLAAARKDMINAHGKRNAVDGDMHLLKGFEFNANASLGNAFSEKFKTGIDRSGGEMKIRIPAFVPNEKLSGPNDATHYRLISAAIELDLSNYKYLAREFLGELNPIDEVQTATVDIVHYLTPNSSIPILLVLGVVFYMVVNGETLPVGGVSANALSIVAVDIV